MSEQGAGKNTGAGYKRKDIKGKDEKAYEILEFPTKKVILTNQDKKKREWYRGGEKCQHSERSRSSIYNNTNLHKSQKRKLHI